MISFDDFLDIHVKSGWYQVRMFIVVSFVDFIDAMESAFLGIFLSILSSEWSLSTREIIGLGTSFYVGIMTGSAFCALNADTIGRKNLITIGTLLTFFTFVLNSQVRAYWQVFSLRLAFGVVFGMIMPLSSILLGEMVTKGFRGRVQACLSGVYIFGKIYMILTCYIFLDDLKGGNWRGLLLFNSLPALVCFILSFLFLRESARFFISQGRFVQGFQELNYMGKNNQSQEFQITTQQKDNLVFWQMQTFQRSDQQQQQIGLKDLINPENRSVFLRLAFIFVTLYVSLAIIYQLLPFWLQDREKAGFMSILQTYLAELAAVVILYTIIDKKQFGGRLRIIKFSLFCMCISVIFTYLYPKIFLIIGISLTKFFATLVYPSLIVYTNENFNTTQRSMALGAAQAISRFASALTPLVAFTLYAQGPFYPLIFVIICLSIATLIAFTFKFDKTQESLDEQNKNL